MANPSNTPDPAPRPAVLRAAAVVMLGLLVMLLGGGLVSGLLTLTGKSSPTFSAVRPTGKLK